MPRYQEIPLDELCIDPENYRRSYVDAEIKSLADSIGEYGLLQNLVVKELDDGRFLVVAGNKRLFALQELQRRQQMAARERVMCLVLTDHDGVEAWISLAENFKRSDVAPWDTGFRFLEMIEAGLTGGEVAARAGITGGTVSNYCTIARGLAPEVIRDLERLGHSSISKAQYLMIARQTDGDGIPVLKEQRALLQRFLTTRKQNIYKPKKRKSRYMEKVYERFLSICEGKTKVPPHATGFVNPLLAYLAGESKALRFPPAVRRLKKGNSKRSRAI